MASPPQSQRSPAERRAEILERLLTRERSALTRQAQLHSRRAQDADDALGDACVQFLRFYDGPAGLDALRWMLLVTKRCAWAIARQRSPRISGEAGDTEDVAALAAEERSGPAELCERREETAEAARLIASLKEAEREALLLFALGYSYKEIAELRGWSITKVNRCIAEGRARVRELQMRGVKP
jgi:DNA-directed RNA polymerase specialized sigma24 family protein